VGSGGGEAAIHSLILSILPSCYFFFFLEGLIVKTIGEVLPLAARFLEEKGVERAKRVVDELLAWILKCKRMDLYMQFDRPVNEKELVVLRDLLKRCAKQEPVEYVIGEVEFGGCRILVDQRVLIPRPETELLVEMVKKRGKGKLLWDVCTGSGAIGIALAKQFEVTISDVCPDALAVARKNVELNEVQVQVLEGDLLAPFTGAPDIVVCNPPYVTESEYLNCSSSVRDFEPRGALVGGLTYYERLAKELPPCQLFLEIGCGQGAAVKEIFGGKGVVEKDWAGHDRFFFLER
jgi:release factor glutamine methyltransferase